MTSRSTDSLLGMVCLYAFTAFASDAYAGVRFDDSAPVLLAQADACPEGQLMIGGSCRSLSKKAANASASDVGNAAAEACPEGQVMIGTSCRALTKKTTNAPASDGGGTKAESCPEGKVMIGTSCRSLTRKATNTPPASEDGSDTVEGCAQGQVMIGSSCRSLTKKTTDTAPAEQPSNDTAEACPQGKVMIGTSCRALTKKTTRTTAPQEESDVTAEVCPEGQVMIGKDCRTPGNQSSRPVGIPAVEPDADVVGQMWTYSEFNDPDDNDMNAQLIYGVPETDNTQFTASCSARSGGGQPRVILSAVVSDLEIGAPVSVRFKGADFDRKFLGVARRDESGEGQQGADVTIEGQDELWQAFSRLSSVTYRVGAEEVLRLPLAGIRNALADFLDNCDRFSSESGTEVVSDATRLFADDGVDGGPGLDDPFADGGDGVSCAAMANVRSKDGGVPVKVTFVNRTEEYRVIDWLDFTGMPVQYAQLEPGQSFTVTTNSTHPWMATDGPGNCIERFMPSNRPGEIAITRKSPGFGPE